MSLSEILAELRGLRQEVAEIGDRVSALEASAVPAAAPAAGGSAPVTVNYTCYSTPPSSPAPIGQVASEQVPVTPPRRTSTPLSSSSALEPQELERQAAAISIGRFLRRCLNGEPRGESGRSRINLSSTVYILCRDFEGRCYNPPQLHPSYGSISPLVKRGGRFGDSVFVGLPSRWEAKLSVETAGLIWPSDGGN